jgi:hypothetical protein
MGDEEPLLERAARWQAERRALSWTEKVRLVERVLPDLRAWRDMRARLTAAASDTGDRPPPDD